MQSKENAYFQNSLLPPMPPAVSFSQGGLPARRARKACFGVVPLRRRGRGCCNSKTTQSSGVSEQRRASTSQSPEFAIALQVVTVSRQKGESQQPSPRASAASTHSCACPVVAIRPSASCLVHQFQHVGSSRHFLPKLRPCTQSAGLHPSILVCA